MIPGLFYGLPPEVEKRCLVAYLELKAVQTFFGMTSEEFMAEFHKLSTEEREWFRKETSAIVLR